MCVFSAGWLSSIINGLLPAPHQLPRCSSCSLVLHDRFMMLHDGFHPRIHVDKDEVLAKIIDDCSFEDAGDVAPRPGALPKGTAGSTPLERLEHEERRGIKTRGEHAERRATGAGVHIMPIGRKHRRLFLFGIRWRRRPSVTYTSTGGAAKFLRVVGREREGVSGREWHLFRRRHTCKQAAHTVRA